MPSLDAAALLDAARALGVNVGRYKLAAFVISAVYASIAGAFHER